mgnify:CR=1 FL=1
MNTFSSPEVLINKSAKELFFQLSNLENLKKIMPSEIEEFKATTDNCSFKISGMPEIKLELTEKTPYTKIVLTDKSSQIPFSLECNITEKGHQCQAKLELNAELNMMMRMMLEKPLTQFLDTLASKMQYL